MASDPPDRSPLERFTARMVIDYEKWHDGIGYDLEAIAAMSPEEKTAAEAILIPRAGEDWRDVEALEALGTPVALAALARAGRHGSPRIRLAVARHAPRLVDDADRVAAIVTAIENLDFSEGLTQALEQAAEFHPPPVRFALQRALLTRPGPAAVHFAALLFYLHGKAKEPFDWEHRPFFLRFNTEDTARRKAAYHELCETLGIPRLPGT